MSVSVLVTYASRYGSTREVAERITEIIKTDSLEAEILPCNQVNSLDAYTFIIIGTPFYIGKMLKDAKDFIIRFQKDLASKKVSFFALGPLSDVEKELADTQEQMEEELKQFPWLTPLSMEMFGGKYDPQTLRFADKILTLLPASPLYKRPASDVRNWEKINRWVKNLPLS